MKNLVILGASRAGKSTLAREINKLYPNYHIIRGDCIRYDVRFVDTSYNREEVLKNLINELKEELKK